MIRWSPTLMTPILTGTAIIIVALLARWVLLRALSRRETAQQLVRPARLPSLLWCFVLGGYGALQVADLPVRAAARFELWIEALLIASVTLSLAAALALVTAHQGGRLGLTAPVTGLGQTIVRFATIAVGTLVVLSTLGLTVTPILTALGVGGLAVALALQDSLANFFAGIHLLADRPIAVGDYVKLDSGVEGYVLDIGWRSTHIRTLPNNVVVIPNQTMAKAIITNFNLPEPRMSLLVPVSVSYQADPDQVERVLVEEAMKAAAEVPGLLDEPRPFVRFIPGFGDHSLDFTLICQVASFVDQYLAQHELRKRILARFRAEGIEIPYPVRTVVLQQADWTGPKTRDE